MILGRIRHIQRLDNVVSKSVRKAMQSDSEFFLIMRNFLEIVEANDL
jgi:hypothetical protein